MFVQQTRNYYDLLAETFSRVREETVEPESWRRRLSYPPLSRHRTERTEPPPSACIVLGRRPLPLPMQAQRA